MTTANQHRADAPRILPKTGLRSVQSRPLGAILLFAAVYVAVLAIMFAPKGSFISTPQQAAIQSE